LDADDVCFAKKLENQVAPMEECGSETGLVYCGTTLLDEYGNFLRDIGVETIEGSVCPFCVQPLLKNRALSHANRARKSAGMRRLDLNLRIADILAFVWFQNTCCHIACPAPV